LALLDFEATLLDFAVEGFAVAAVVTECAVVDLVAAE